MSHLHRIRLPSPWNLRVIARSGISPAHEDAAQEVPDKLLRVQVPSDWSAILGREFRGRVEYRRFFHCPTGIDADTAVKLCLELIDGDATVWLNEALLGTAGWPDFPKRFDLTGRLERRNELRIEVELLTADASPIGTSRPPGRLDSDAGGLVGEVHIEIG